MNDEREKVLLHLYRRKDVSEAHREVLLDAINTLACDDAIHIAAPWERRSSLCGNWNRNLVALDEPRPDGFAGCWTCLIAAEWLDNNLDTHRPTRSEHSLEGAAVNGLTPVGQEADYRNG